jgi:hypothetical protein
MKKLIMLLTVALVAPMFGARPILKYGDINPITGKVVERYKESRVNSEGFSAKDNLLTQYPKKSERVNKGRLTKKAEEQEMIFTPTEQALFMEEEQEMVVPEEKTSFVDQNGIPIPPALPRPSTSTKPSKQFTNDDLKLRPTRKPVPKLIEVQAHKAPTHEKEEVGVSTGAAKGVPFTGEELKIQARKLRKPVGVKPAGQKNDDQKALEAAVLARRPAIEAEEEEAEDWD